MRNPELTPEPVPAAAPKPSEDNLRHPRTSRPSAALGRAPGTRRRAGQWAVPKGVPETPAENRLAVHTEDHPIEYLDFSATIPKGQYGGGGDTIWDTGTYETEKWRERAKATR